MQKTKLAWVVVILAAGACGLGGCEHLNKAKEIAKIVETKGYDGAAQASSGYCQGAGFDGTGIIDQERLELRREIRQRGTNGPVVPVVEGLDEKTANGQGPIIRVYCAGETVPEAVARDLIRVRP